MVSTSGKNQDAYNCLPIPSSVVLRLSCSPNLITFLLTFLTTKPSLTLNRSDFAFAVIRFYFAFTFAPFLLYFYIVNHRRTYFAGGATQIVSIDWLIDPRSLDHNKHRFIVTEMPRRFSA